MADQSGLERVAGRVTKAGISFLTGIPQIDLDTAELQNRVIEQQAQGLKQQNEAQLIEQAREQQLQNLFGIITNPNSTQAQKNQAANAAAVADPRLVQEFFSAIGITEQADKDRVATRALEVQSAPTREAKNEILRRQIVEGEAEGRDMSASKRLIEAPDNELDATLAFIQAAALTPEQRAIGTRAAVEPFELRTFRGIAEEAELEPEERQRAARINLGLDPRSVGSGVITTAVTPGLTEQVAGSQAEIREAGKFAELTGASRANAIDKGFTTIKGIDKNIRNIDRAIAAIDEGASTGVIESRFLPTFRESTLKLENLQRELGLDVVGSVTFGQLSKGELDLALSLALPLGLQPPELKKFLQDKKSAQQKLRDYYEDQINFLDKGGTIAGFLREQEEKAQPVQAEDELDPSLLEFMTPEERALFGQ